jgi:SAM-dependent methyltransferase
VTVEAENVIWHEAECGGYADDLELWSALAAERGGPILDLGAGSGRVALHLAAEGHEVWAVDSDPGLVAALEERAAERGARITALTQDCRELALSASFPLAIAAMQLVQLLGGPTGRQTMLESVYRVLAAGGVLAAAIVEGVPPAALAADAAPIPDVREVAGTVYSSLPLGAGLTGGVLEVRRLRQVVSPGGDLEEAVHADRLDLLDAGALEREAEAVGLVARDRLEIPAGEAHVGSTVVLLERGGA